MAGKTPTAASMEPSLHGKRNPQPLNNTIKPSQIYICKSESRKMGSRKIYKRSSFSPHPGKTMITIKKKKTENRNMLSKTWQITKQNSARRKRSTTWSGCALAARTPRPRLPRSTATRLPSRAAAGAERDAVGVGRAAPPTTPGAARSFEAAPLSAPAPQPPARLCPSWARWGPRRESCPAPFSQSTGPGSMETVRLIQNMCK